jgi:DNA polymerase elongation subunit (family B)
VCCFGYTGYKNARFGKIEAHEAINAVARETLLVAKEIAENNGFTLLHALVDSLYVWKEGATREDFERLAREIEVKPVFRCDQPFTDMLSFFPPGNMRMCPSPTVLRGRRDGELKVQGLECQRHDTPPLLKKMQHRSAGDPAKRRLR